MKKVSVVLLLIVMFPVLLFALDSRLDLFTANGSTAVGNYFFETFNGFTSRFENISNSMNGLWSKFQSFEPPDPNVNNDYYTSYERKLVLDWEYDNGTMTWFKRWSLSMKYFFTTNVDTDKYNAEYNWSISNPYIKYKT